MQGDEGPSFEIAHLLSHKQKISICNCYVSHRPLSNYVVRCSNPSARFQIDYKKKWLLTRNEEVAKIRRVRKLNK